MDAGTASGPVSPGEASAFPLQRCGAGPPGKGMEWCDLTGFKRTTAAGMGGNSKQATRRQR